MVRATGRFPEKNRCQLVISGFRKLLAAADKYNIVDLKSECEKSLCSSMTVETVSSLLIFAQGPTL
jgi:hypothetical protein